MTKETTALAPTIEEPYWLTLARSYIGVKEIPGPRSNGMIASMFEWVKSKIRDDETAWCAAFVGAIFEMIDIESTRSLAARSYLNWGVSIKEPVVGCVVVFWRGTVDGWSGHVGFVVGVDEKGRLWVLGGNQGDSVSIALFDRTRVLDYRLPRVAERYARLQPPLYASADQPHRGMKHELH